MSGVNIFGESLSSNKNIIPQRGPPGIGFKYLDGSGNFDIDNKRLANVGKPLEKFDAVNKEYSDKHHEILHEIYQRFQMNFNNYLTKLNELKESYDQFIIGNNQYKTDLESTLNLHSSLFDRLQMNEMTYKDSLDNLERNFNEKVVEFTASFNQIGDLLNKEIAGKTWIREIVNTSGRILKEKIDILEVELSSSIAKVHDECLEKIDAIKPKSAGGANVDIDIRKNEGDINLLQDDVIDLKDDIRVRDEEIVKLNKELDEMKRQLQLLVGESLKEGIDTVN